MLLKEIIAEYRKMNNLSQRSFAAKCGVTNGYMSMIENGLNPSTGKPPIPSFSKLKQIAYGMDMTVHQLIQIADDMEIDIGTTEGVDNDIEQFSSAALAVARAYDKMSSYGKSLIDKIIENEKKYKIMKAIPLIGEAINDGSIEAKEAARKELRELAQGENALKPEKI